MRSCGSGEIAHREPPRSLRVFALAVRFRVDVLRGKLQRVEDDTAADALTPEERGLVAGLALLGARGVAIEGSEAALAALGALRMLGRPARAEALAGLMRELAAPRPARLSALHPC